ncbi:MAG: UPF0146 family protein [Haloarculaceae archaeon]
MSDSRQEALAARLSRYETLVEVGVGNRPGLAEALAAAGATVTATDVADRAVGPDVAFVRDDVTDPDPSVYADADAIYARHLPPELHRPALDVARGAGAALLFTTLGGEEPIVPVARESVGGTTLYVADRDAPG